MNNEEKANLSLAWIIGLLIVFAAGVGMGAFWYFGLDDNQGVVKTEPYVPTLAVTPQETSPEPLVTTPEPEPAPEETIVQQAVPAAAAVPEPVQEPIPPVQSEPAYVPITHVAKAGDTYWDLAREYWGDEWLWPTLYMANSERSTHPDHIKPGMEILIPKKPDISVDRQGLAEDYLAAYRDYRSANKKRRALWTLFVARKRYKELVEGPLSYMVDPKDMRLFDTYFQHH